MMREQSSTVHPLLIHHVAKKIFSYFHWSYSNNVFVSCRQVCQAWNELITTGMKRKGLTRTISFGRSDTHAMTKFLQDMEQTVNLPFDKFAFGVDFFICRNTHLFTTFLQRHGSDISALSLQIGKQYSMNLTNVGNIHLVNLKYLVVHCVYLQTAADNLVCDDNTSWIPQSWEFYENQADGLMVLLEAILSSADQLKHVDISIPSKHFEGVYGPDANVRCANLIAHCISSSVQNLKLVMELHDSHLHHLRKLKLHQLHINFYGSRLNHHSLNHFLRSQASTLIDLKIADFENYVTIQSELRQVKVLDIKEDLSTFKFLQNFPSTQKLVLRKAGNSQRVPTDSYNDPNKAFYSYPLVSHLELTYPVDQKDMIGRLVSTFPNLKVLRLDVGFDSIPVLESLFELMSGLEQLELFFSQYFTNKSLDPIFTGLPLGWCYRIHENSLYTHEDQSRIFLETRRKPSLGNLLKLQRLVIGSELQSYSLHITDVTVHYAIFRMPSLREVFFDNNTMISAHGIQLLEQRLRTRATRSRPENVQQSRQSTSWALVPMPCSNH